MFPVRVPCLRGEKLLAKRRLLQADKEQTQQGKSSNKKEAQRCKYTERKIKVLGTPAHYRVVMSKVVFTGLLVLCQYGDIRWLRTFGVESQETNNVLPCLQIAFDNL